MNEKQLTQIEEWLRGQKRYKLLDTERKDILRLKGSKLQVWLAQYMSESDEQEAWLSLSKLQHLTGLSENTVIEARKWLQENGWIRATGQVAADKYENPTRGAHKVKVLSVDAPKEPPAEIAGAEIAGANVIPPKIEDKVYVSGSASGSGSGSSSVPLHSDCEYPLAAVKTPSLRSEERNAKPETTPTTKPTPKTSASPVGVEAQAKARHNSKYDEPFPLEFDSWSVQARAEWCVTHAVKPKKEPVQEKKDSAPIKETEKPLPVPAKEEPAPPKLEVKPTPKVQPPSPAPPPTPVTAPTVPPPAPAKALEQEPDLPHDRKMGQKIAGDLRMLQAHYNGNVQPSTDWETVWEREGVDLYNLCESKGSYIPPWGMLQECIVVSQVNHATSYTSPSLIAQHIPELVEEVLALRTADKLDPMWDAYLHALEYLTKPEEGDPADIERRRVKQNDRMIKRWTEWVEKNLQLQANG